MHRFVIRPSGLTRQYIPDLFIMHSNRVGLPDAALPKTGLLLISCVRHRPG